VIERHRNTGNIGKGFVRGFGLKQGALASSVAHDSHNIITVGANDEDMKIAVLKVIEMKGGIAVSAKGELRASLALPIAGLMSKDPMKIVCRGLDHLFQVVRALGCTMDDPVMSLSFVALPVIPELKITDLGLVDVAKFEIIPLFVH
jgi:adenine deaminase